MRFVLLISREFIVANAVGRSGFANGVLFRNTEPDKSKFADYLEERRGGTFSGIIDSGDEEFAVEELPKLNARDRKRAVNSIVQSRYNDGSLWKCHSQLSAGESGKKLQLRLTGLPESSQCSEWLEIFQKQQVLLSELCLLSDICGEIRSSFAIKPTVLVLQMSFRDYRLFGFRHDSPVISRSLAVPENGDFTQLKKELEKTRQFAGKGVKDDNTGDVVFIGSGEVHMLESLKTSNITVMEPAEIAIKGLSTKIAATNVIDLITRMMLVRKIRVRHRLNGVYRTPFTRRKSHHAQLAGVCCCLSLAVLSGMAGARVVGTLNELTSNVQEQTQSLDVRLTTDHPKMLEHDGKVDAIRSAVEIGNRIHSVMAHTPMQLLNLLAIELSRVPEVQLSSVVWSLQSPENVIDLSGSIEHRAIVSGYLESTDKGPGELARDFITFINGLQNTSQIDFVEVNESPFGVSRDSATRVSASRRGEAKFLITLGFSEPAQGSL